VSQNLFLGFPIPVALALAALLLVLLGLVRVLASLGRPFPLRVPHAYDDAHDEMEEPPCPY
jgi:heme A synthase